ncbi:hypothetical protein BGZ61DRAFT_78280 [Ilyonectria robusta]|uniref:uncharacterized protein n=1 Tax=Ilyonectria robusta TaxID=1079257 RepID=UPI001E8CF7FF|nr:uncharacterized protein BGZ61DRAFT_78280 [Ilyonectria robusta]KAH8735402.1 hypothetical protein BGZ61DRAFT_78280 [Ilyonectria robusta]
MQTQMHERTMCRSKQNPLLSEIPYSRLIRHHPITITSPSNHTTLPTPSRHCPDTCLWLGVSRRSHGNRRAGG